MAKIIPPYSEDYDISESLTDGELFIVTQLKYQLDDSWEVYVKPFLNGDRPDIVLLSTRNGALVIEVKDWMEESYLFDENRWIDVEKSLPIQSPFDQVKRYKDEMYNLHIPGLLTQKSINSGYYGLIQCLVYFHNFSTSPQTPDDYSNVTTQHDWIRKGAFAIVDSILPEGRVQRLNVSQDLWEAFQKELAQPCLRSENPIKIVYTKEQKNLIESSDVERKIKGVAGAGKSLVLAQRAVNAHRRTGARVLVLCFNITLVNYLRDKICSICGDIDIRNFEIIHYHGFVSKLVQNDPQYGSELVPKNGETSESYSARVDTDFFSNVGRMKNIADRSKGFQPYGAIFIDEVQDYMYSWLEVVKRVFLKSKGEFVVFGDEKQNIYGRDSDKDKLPKTNVLGRWNESLKSSQRMDNEIVDLAYRFQSKFLSEYTIAEIEHKHAMLEFDNAANAICYRECQSERDICYIIQNHLDKYRIDVGACCVVSSDKASLRKIDYFYRHTTKRSTVVTFECYESIEASGQRYRENYQKKVREAIRNEDLRIALRRVIDSLDSEGRKATNKADGFSQFERGLRTSLKMDIQKQEGVLKRHFTMRSEDLKLSTIHSFKGWEVPCLVLVLGDVDRKLPNHELIYTAITRCRNNLLVVGLGTDAYKGFFSKNITGTDSLDSSDVEF